MDPRSALLASAPVLVDLVDAAADRWEADSALDRMTVGDLAAHAARAVSTAVTYLDADEPVGPVDVDAVGYFLAVDGLGDPTSDTNAGIRRRAASEAAFGSDAVAGELRSNIAKLERLLRVVSAERTVAVFDGLVITLDDYLVTRLVEIIVHADDLTASLGLPDAEFPERATDLVVETLVGIARRRHGDLAVVRALTRRERDAAEAMRVL